MATDKKRLGLGLGIGGGVVVAGAVLSWFTILPYVAEQKINAELETISARIDRRIAVSDLRLTGLRSAHVGRLTISDVGKPEMTGVRLDSVDVALTKIPWGDDFSVDRIEINDIEVALRRDGDKTNFDDIVEALKEKPASREPKKAKKTPRWKQVLTPWPEVRIETASLAMAPIDIDSEVKLGAITIEDLAFVRSEDRIDDAMADDAHADNLLTPYDVSGQISFLLVEGDTRESYKTNVSGQIRSAIDGNIALSLPKSDKGETPVFLNENGFAVRFDAARFVLPTTIEVDALDVTTHQMPFIAVERVRAQFMQLPPKKVSGVYFKEIELTAPKLQLVIRDDMPIMHSFMALEDVVKPLISQKKSGDAANSGAGTEPKKAKKPKDYFISQRFFITDGSVSIDDQRNDGWLRFGADQIDAEIGYRSIRKVLDYKLDLRFAEPVVSSFSLAGEYAMRGSESTAGKVSVSSMRAGDALKRFQTPLREGVAVPEANAQDAKSQAMQADAAPIVKQYLPAMDLSHAELAFDIDYDVDVAKEILDMKATLSTSGAMFQIDAFSREPFELRANFTTDAKVLWKEKKFDIEAFRFTIGDNTLNMSVDIEPMMRKIKTKGGGFDSEEAWHFDVRADLLSMPMQSLFEAIPHALRTDLDGLQWQGSIGLTFKANGFFSDISDVEHAFELTTSDDFAVVSWPEMRDINMLSKGFTHRVIDPNALVEHDIVIPPSLYPIVIGDMPIYVPRQTEDDIREMYPHWVIFDDINPWLIQLITTTEDGSFFTHKGFSPLQVKAAMARNIARKSFSRGASTISMQLVKNIFFDRTKSVSRKFQEVLYTWLMESVVQIPKKRIMELYFNVIEFGPEIYGIEEAAKFYFGKRSRDLSLKECAFLMAIIPNPRKGAVYRLQPTLPKPIAKTMNFYINEMYRRKCDATAIAKMHARYAKRNEPVPFEPCCPPQDSLQLMLESDEMAFYVPDAQDSTKYAWRPDIYDENGTPIVPMKAAKCGYRGGNVEEIDGEDFDPASDIEQDGSIFGTFNGDEINAHAAPLNFKRNRAF